MSRALRAWWFGAAMTLALAPNAYAQFTPPAGRFEISGGVDWLGRSSLGAREASETTATGSATPLFNTSTTLESAPAVTVRLGARVSRRLEAEAFLSYAKPKLSTTVTNDIESSGSVIASETVTQYQFGGGVLWYLSSRTWERRWPRLQPFADGGAAFLRQLHESNTLAVNGQAFHVGGGVKYWLSPKAGKRLKGTGLRGDVRLLMERKGIGFDNSIRSSPSVGVSFFARF